MAKEIIKNKKNYIVLIVLILGWFYWFQLRPAQIRKDCSSKTKEAYDDAFQKNDNDPNTTGDTLNDDRIPKKTMDFLLEQRDRVYEYCLNSKGINK